MRVLITLLALVTAPFLASVSQEPAGSPSRTDNDAVRHSEAGKVEDQDNDDGDAHCWSGEHDAAWATHSQGPGHHRAKGPAKHACAPPHTGWGQTSPMTARACAPFDLSPSGLTWSSAGRTPKGYGYTVVVPPGLVAPQTWLANDFGNKTP